MSLLLIIVMGLAAGLVARMLVPGANAMGLVATIVLGVVGSFVGGFVGSLASGVRFNPSMPFAEFHLSGLLFSSIGAILTLVIVQALFGARIAANNARERS